MASETIIENSISLFGNFLEVTKLDKVIEKTGERYGREKTLEGRFCEWVSNPGSVRIGEEKIEIKVLRIHDNQNLITESPEIYQKLRSIDLPSESL